MTHGGGWRMFLSPSYCGSLMRSTFVPLLSLIILSTVLSIPIGAQVSPDKHVLIINKMGLSHSLTDFITQQIVGSLVLFREASLWERTKWIWATCILVIAILFSIAGYLLYSRKQLRLARDRQTQLSGMLITAGENERSRLASELHDDFSQRLAVLALGLENMTETTPPLPQETHRQLHKLLDSAAELGADLHTLSHRLHSATLERLGLATGISALCREFAAQQNVPIDFSSDTISRSVHPDVALCLFRIVQEGLRNSRKHSGATKAQVILREQGDTLYVSVRDKGCGFDVKELGKKSGLGIRSMEERVHYLGGKFELHSEPGKGTTVEAWVSH